MCKITQSKNPPRLRACPLVFCHNSFPSSVPSRACVFHGRVTRTTSHAHTHILSHTNTSQANTVRESATLARVFSGFWQHLHACFLVLFLACSCCVCALSFLVYFSAGQGGLPITHTLKIAHKHTHSLSHTHTHTHTHTHAYADNHLLTHMHKTTQSENEHTCTQLHTNTHAQYITVRVLLIVSLSCPLHTNTHAHNYTQTHKHTITHKHSCTR